MVPHFVHCANNMAHCVCSTLISVKDRQWSATIPRMKPLKLKKHLILAFLATPPFWLNSCLTKSVLISWISIAIHPTTLVSGHKANRCPTSSHCSKHPLASLPYNAPHSRPPLLTLGTTAASPQLRGVPCQVVEAWEGDSLVPATCGAQACGGEGQ